MANNDTISPEEFGKGIIGDSPALQQVFKIGAQVAPTNATVLITGESGTGKELIARALYQNSRRSQKPFLAINCAAIPENLLESELFGHERGSFTGAHLQRVGKFEQCDSGTIFLDEIGDMPLTTQTKILRVLQDGEYSRIGSNHSLKTDVRIIAATNKDLWHAVQRKEFREDLFYRLNVVRIHLPSLRERITDLPALVAHFSEKFSRENQGKECHFSEEVMNCLQHYVWPGNVRELENCIQRAVVLASDGAVTLSHLPQEINRKNVFNSATGKAAAVLLQEISVEQAVAVLFSHARKNLKFKLLHAAERELILLALAETGGNQVKAAKLLGITRATLRNRIEKFKIQKRLEMT